MYMCIVDVYTLTCSYIPAVKNCCNKKQYKFLFLYYNNYILVVFVKSLFMSYMSGMPHVVDDKICILDVWYASCVCRLTKCALMINFLCGACLVCYGEWWIHVQVRWYMLDLKLSHAENMSLSMCTQTRVGNWNWAVPGHLPWKISQICTLF